MASKGWIKLHRTMRDHYLWGDKPFARGQAWIDLLMMASHEDNKFMLGGDLIESKAGDVVTSEVKLMDRWGWSKTKVRKFLKLLETDQMIIKKADRKKTTIFIVNWGKYQNGETTEKLQKDRRETAEKPQRDTINNVKEGFKNGENRRSPSSNKFINFEPSGTDWDETAQQVMKVQDIERQERERQSEPEVLSFE